jgi:hypothetical protein
MLLNIKTGYRGITKVPMDQIVYISCEITTMLEHCSTWCFTDGHAKTSITGFYNNLDDLDKIDWSLVGDRFWKNSEEDSDRMRRKQAEFLVKDHVPVEAIGRLIVYNSSAEKAILQLNRLSDSEIQIQIDANYYY